MHLKLILSLILAGFSVLFVIQNVALVEVRFLVWSLFMTLSLLIFLLLAVGLTVGWLMHSYWAYRRKGADQTAPVNEIGHEPGAGGRKPAPGPSSAHDL